MSTQRRAQRSEVPSREGARKFNLDRDGGRLKEPLQVCTQAGLHSVLTDAFTKVPRYSELVFFASTFSPAIFEGTSRVTTVIRFKFAGYLGNVE